MKLKKKKDQSVDALVLLIKYSQEEIKYKNKNILSNIEGMWWGEVLDFNRPGDHNG